MKIRKAVIPAAGFGTRMLPATKTIPKEMLILVDRPIIHHIVEEAAAAGIEDILIVTSRGKAAMEDYFDYAPEIEASLRRTGKEDLAEQMRRVADMANIFYIRQKQTLGLGHAVLCARDFVGDEPFAVLLGDDVMRSETPVIGQLVRTAETYGAAVVGAQEVSLGVIGRYSSLDVSPVDGRVYDVGRVIEKPWPEQVYSRFAILGRYVLTPAIFDILETLPPGFGGEIQLTDAINILCARDRVMALDFEGARYDTGNLNGYLEATVDLALGHAELGPWLKEFLKGKL